MTSGAYDFTGYQVLVVGGTRGEGHAIATAFAGAGASVTVTGTMMLRSLYDTDLTPFAYESVNLARQPSIDHLAGVVDQLDVLVLAATCNLPYGLPGSEQAFVAEAVRSGLLGPTFLTTRLRLKLGQSPALGGGCVINTGALRTWLELSATPEAAQDQVVESTARAGEQWARLGVRVNTVLPAPRSVLPRQYARPSPPPGGARAAGGTLVHSHQQRVSDAVTQAALLLQQLRLADHRTDAADQLSSASFRRLPPRTARSQLHSIHLEVTRDPQISAAVSGSDAAPSFEGCAPHDRRPHRPTPPPACVVLGGARVAAPS